MELWCPLDKHEAEAVQEVTHGVIEATRPPSSEEAWYEILHGRSYPYRICGKTYKRSQQLSTHKIGATLPANPLQMMLMP